MEEMVPPFQIISPPTPVLAPLQHRGVFFFLRKHQRLWEDLLDPCGSQFGTSQQASNVHNWFQITRNWFGGVASHVYVAGRSRVQAYINLWSCKCLAGVAADRLAPHESI